MRIPLLIAYSIGLGGQKASGLVKPELCHGCCPGRRGAGAGWDLLCLSLCLSLPSCAVHFPMQLPNKYLLKGSTRMLGTITKPASLHRDGYGKLQRESLLVLCQHLHMFSAFDFHPFTSDCVWGANVHPWKVKEAGEKERGCGRGEHPAQWSLELSCLPDPTLLISSPPAPQRSPSTDRPLLCMKPHRGGYEEPACEKWEVVSVLLPHISSSTSLLPCLHAPALLPPSPTST